MGYLDNEGVRYIWGKVRAALSAKQDKFSGRPGQAVGFTAQGEAAAVEGWSNPNLLDNWYFASPVNQRGAEQYGGPGYTIDRWRLDGTGASLRLNSGLTLSGGTTTAFLNQKLENAGLLEGQTATFSILTKAGEFYSATGIYKGSEFHVTPPSGWCGVNEDGDVYLSAPAGGSGGFLAVKLELGNTQTLARQDETGAWRLLAIPDFAAELTRCQRYFVRLNYLQNEAIGLCAYNKDWAVLSIPLPVQMRLEYPAMSATCDPMWVQDSLMIPDGPIVAAKGNHVTIGFSLEGVTANASLVGAGSAGHIDFDANL